MVEEIMSRLRFSKEMSINVQKLVKFHMVRSDDVKGSTIRRFMRKYGDNELMPTLFKLKVADRMAGSKARGLDFSAIYRRLFAIEEEMKKKPPLDVTSLNITGREMMRIGFKGKEIGTVLEMLLEIVTDNPEDNTLTSLFEHAEGIYREQQR